MEEITWPTLTMEQVIRSIYSLRPVPMSISRSPRWMAFGNKIIHRAELVAVKIPSLDDNVFSAPDQLMLDRKNSNTPDTVFMLEKDLVADASGNLGFSSFGGICDLIILFVSIFPDTYKVLSPGMLPMIP